MWHFVNGYLGVKTLITRGPNTKCESSIIKKQMFIRSHHKHQQPQLNYQTSKEDSITTRHWDSKEPWKWIQ
jgi:hypothetical protein